MKLTTYLPTTTPTAFPNATTHPFLRLAGTGKIPKPLLSQWLSQDRLYAQSYVRFMGLLLSKIRLPCATPTSTPTSSTSTSKQAMNILIDALTNIRTELDFFENVAVEYGLDLGPCSSSSSSCSSREIPEEEEKEEEGKFTTNTATPITQAYIDMFMSAGSAATSLLEGMVVLWATEVCYLRAWRYAAGFLDSAPAGADADADGGALRNRFIPNWSSAEFGAFVDAIGEVVDDLAEEVGGEEKKKEEILGRCVRWWKQVVWLEERFWPDV
ncbi:hypothetical protein AOCH_006349 [Aspergillus ochraceoroseus]|uniref:Thiaminase-2/PQQC domain-containing protein n=2 Tax=Aspergillus ochraceoroseus TaxID=138278 RepID=A0A0F8W8N6_9EURO|nr:hypothetical protein AOCH_006349 [Aspergillus ochraceoroseus]